MIENIAPQLTIKLDRHHLWCPSPFIHDGRLFIAAAVWPQGDFEGWRVSSRLRLFEIRTEDGGGFTADGVDGWGIECDPDVSVINPRIVSTGQGFHLFCSRVMNKVRYDIAYAAFPSMASISLLTPVSIIGDESREGRQGPTNPAPVLSDDGQWRMLFRDSTGVGGKRSLFAATTRTPSAPWKLIDNSPVIEGDLEDPFVWQSSEKHLALVRDIGGTVTGKAWPAIGLMETDDWMHWRPSSAPHVCNRSIPQHDGSTIVMHRLERPAIMSHRGKRLLFFACLATPDSAATIRMLELREPGSDLMLS